MKHAYCILAHGCPDILKTLVGLLDDPRNDIYLHLDAKADAGAFRGVRPVRAGFVFVKDRVDVHWGAPSLVRAEMAALSAASQNGRYAYCHLLSGVDLPLKSQDYIHAAFASRTEEFFDIRHDAFNMKALATHTKWRYLFTEHYHDPNPLRGRMFDLLRRAFLKVQKVTGWERHFRMSLHKGSAWFSATGACVDWLLERRDWMAREFRYVHASDEIAVPTAFMMSPFAGNVSAMGNMRDIEWRSDGSPHVYALSDIDKLQKSHCLFARKFSSDHMDAVHAVEEFVRKSS